jgi:hypothetical protein
MKQVTFSMDDLFEDLKHLTDPTLFKVIECGPDEWVTLDYLNKVEYEVEVTYELWSEADDAYVAQRPFHYYAMTRATAFTTAILALNTGAQGNHFKARYCNVRTRVKKEEGEE